MNDFIEYFEKVRSRTLRVALCIPPHEIEWRPKPNMFSYGDILRHLAAIERHMYAENVLRKPSRYAGCGPELATGKDDILTFLNLMHAESMTIFRSLSNEDVKAKCKTPAGSEITVWKWLRLMAEHEIHHRGQLYSYLAMMGIKSPPIYGLTSEEVVENSVH